LPDFEALMAQIAGTAPEDNNSEETVDTDLDQDVDTQDDDQAPAVTDPPAFDPNSITDPVLQEQYRQMQASFTPRLQEAAELRKQYEGVDPSVLEAVRQYQNLLTTNPHEAREYLVQQQAWLDQQLQIQQQPADPFANITPCTDTEEALVAWGRQMYQQQIKQEAYYQQQEFARRQEAVGRKFAELESAHGTQIPLEERQAVIALCNQTGCTDVATAWKAFNFDRAVQKGVQKGAKTVRSKQAAPPPPTNKQGRSAPPAPSKAKGINAHFEEAWNKYSGS
jgi:hypothetical protein